VTMPRVATPDRRVKIIESEADLKALQTEYKLSSTLVANLRQLLGWTGVGTRCRKTCRTGPIKIVRHEKRRQGKRCTCRVYTS
jgi:predicted metal-binding membrane protein